MNKRSFKRAMGEPELKEGWTRGKERLTRHKASSLEEALRGLFEEILKNALEEIGEQEEKGIGAPINSWGTIRDQNGQIFRLQLECEPRSAPIDPNLN